MKVHGTTVPNTPVSLKLLIRKYFRAGVRVNQRQLGHLKSQKSVCLAENLVLTDFMKLVTRA